MTLHEILRIKRTAEKAISRNRPAVTSNRKVKELVNVSLALLSMLEEDKPTPTESYDDHETMVQTALELYARACNAPKSKKMHDAAIAARKVLIKELERLKTKSDELEEEMDQVRIVIEDTEEEE